MLKRLLIVALLSASAFGQMSATGGMSMTSGMSLMGAGASNPFPGLPAGVGWHSLGTPGLSYLDTSLGGSPADGTAPTYVPNSGSSNQCPPNNFNGTTGLTWQGTSGCYKVVNSQSSGIADTYRNIFYQFGGGHADYPGNETYGLDLNTNPVQLRRRKDPTVKDGGGNVAIGWATGGNPNPDWANPNACMAGIPADITSTGFTITNITGNGSSGTTDITLSSPASFIVNTANTGIRYWVEGKAWVRVTGTTNFNGLYQVTGVPSSTHIQIAKTVTAVESSGTAAYTWTGCVANSTTGLGCSPNAIHSIEETTYLHHAADPTQDVMFKVGGSPSCGGGGSFGADAWTIPLDGGITNSSAWTANHDITGYVLPAGTNFGFPQYTAFDTTNEIAFYLDHGNSSLYAWDQYGTKGAAKTWYRLNNAGFNNTSAMAAEVWHNAGDTQRLFFAVGGCTQSQVTAGSRTANSETLTLNGVGPDNDFSGGTFRGKLWVYNMSDATMNVDAITTATVTLGASPTVQFTNAGADVASSSGGFALMCQVNSGIGGISMQDVTAGTTAGSRNDWTNATFANNNTDANGSLGYNTCAEAFSGGHYTSTSPFIGPLNGAVTGGVFKSNGGISPGITLYTGPTIAGVADTGNIGVWPNQGGNYYDVKVNVASNRLECRRSAFTGDVPANSNHVSATDPNTTWGTWHRFSYFPAADAFVLINAPDQPARILRIH
jgi:hypothetical protein